MKNLWSVFDEDGKNEVPIEELATIMRALDVDIRGPGKLEEIQKKIDPDNKGYITFENLKIVMEDELKDPHTIEVLIDWLKKLDRDGDGKIPSPEFKQYMLNMGSKMAANDLDAMMDIADPKKDGYVDIFEFADKMCPNKK